MRIAAVTYVYNEIVNLDIWRKYYGSNFGEENLYVIDRCSDDGSTDDIGPVNKLRVPRIPFDDLQKIAMINAMHTALLQSFDCVIVTDCDEIIVPDPQKFSSLRAYVEEVKPAVSTCIGLNVHHLINLESPLDITKQVLSQRRFADFRLPTCKPAISSVPTQWEPGGHVCNQTLRVDPNLFLFHIKFMDYNIAMKRQRINQETQWSERSPPEHGAHHRYNYERFVREGFLDPINNYQSEKVKPFEFEAETEAMMTGGRFYDKMYWPGDAARKLVEIPERFQEVF